MYDDHGRDEHRDTRAGHSGRAGGGGGGPGRGRGRGGPGGGGGGGHGEDRWGGGGMSDRHGRGVPLADLDPALTEVSRKLIGAAIEVHKSLGPGFERSVYINALEVEMKAIGLAFKRDHRVSVLYRGQEVGSRSADLFIEGRFVVDLLAQNREIGGGERSALRAMLRAADLELGLIINFSERRLKDGLVRVLNPDKLNLARAGEGGPGDGRPGGGDHDDDNPLSDGPLGDGGPRSV